MNKSSFESQLSTRLAENKRIYEKPGLFGKLSLFGSVVGLYGFWIILVLSLVMSIWFVNNGYNQTLNKAMFGALYE